MLFFLVGLVSLILYVLFRQAFIVKAMIDYLRDKHNLPVCESLLAQIRENAVLHGLEVEYDRYIQAIKKEVGEGNVKNGHVLWVLEQLDNDTAFHDGMTLPRF